MKTDKIQTALFLLILFTASFLSAQVNKINLQECYNLAYKNYPDAKQIDLYRSSNELRIKNLNVNYLPQITFKGQASYQSDVTKFLLNTPLFKPAEPPKDRYAVTMDITQLIYDGGNTSSVKAVETAQMFIDQQKAEVNLYSLKSKINELYFSVLLLQEKQKVFEILMEDIANKIREVESKVKNEVLTPVNLYTLQAQLVQTEQEIVSVKKDKSASVKMLQELIGTNIPDGADFILPDPGNADYNGKINNRPEYKLFEFQKNQLTAFDDYTVSKIIPKISAFGQAGYGKPGLNYLDDSYKGFYMFGLNISWNPVNWGANSNEKQINTIRRNIIETQKETFNKNLKVSLEKYMSDIYKYEELILKDNEVLSLREKIISSVYSQFLNGAVTSTVYLTELNNKTQSELLMQSHKIQLLQSKINYLTAKGDF